MKKCKIENCNKPHDSHGFCGMHAQRYRRYGDASFKIGTKGMYKTMLEAYEGQINKDTDHGCWEWQGNKNKGYGWICLNNERIAAHRFSYQHFVDVIPNDMHVLHRCDNPGCSRPDHLFLGTQKDNMVDRFNKGHNITPSGKTGLTKENVIRIKKLFSTDLSNREIGLIFDITTENVNNIRSEKSWKHVQLKEQ